MSLWVCCVAVIASGCSLLDDDRLAGDGRIFDVGISPDNRDIVYTFERDGTDVDLWRVSVDGAAAQLDGAGHDVWNVTLTPDGGHLIYAADRGPGKHELHSVALHGGAPVRLDADLTSGFYAITPDGRRIVYADSSIADSTLYVVPRDGGPGIELDRRDALGTHFAIDPGGTRVVYRGEITKLYSVRLAGGPVVELSAPLHPIRPLVHDFRLTPDGTTVVFKAAVGPDFETQHLYSVPIAGGAPIDLAVGDNFHWFDVSADGARVVYTSHVEGDQVELRSVPIAGGPTAELCSARRSPSLGRAAIDNIALVRERVLFTAVTTDRWSLHSVPLAGGPAVLLSAPDEDVGSVKLARDGHTALYQHGGHTEVVHVATSGGLLGRFAGPTADRPLGDPVLTSDGTRFVYRFAFAHGAPEHLYVTTLADGTTTELSGQLDGDDEIGRVVLSPDGTFAVYTLDRDGDNPASFAEQLWSVDLLP